MARTKVKSPKGKPECQVTRECLQVLELFAGVIEVERQNTGGMYNAEGQYIPFGRPGNTDYLGQVVRGPWRGARLDLEFKREFFDPRRARGKQRTRFLAQRDRMERTNRGGGIGLWVSAAEQLLAALPKILAGARVEFDADGFPWVVSPDESSEDL
jgi:hypothetical protein